jgi:tyrosyl-tRNA synthetase
MLTFLPLEEIAQMETWEGSQLNRAKEILAFELTKLVHGDAEAQKAQDAARALFTAGGSAEHMPSTELTDADLTDGEIGIVELLLKTGLVPSKSEARRAIEQGGVEVAGSKVPDIALKFTKAQLSGEGIILKRGKKAFNRAFVS